MTVKPNMRPSSPNFSSGPANKRPGWTPAALSAGAFGRSHRASMPKAKLKQVIEETKELLNIPADYVVGIMAGSDTGAIEAAMWSLLGERPVDVFAWDSFGKDWVTDCVKQLRVETRSFVADFGKLPDMQAAHPAHDVVFTWNGTSAGVIVPNADWIKDDREGLTFCDATSAVLAVDMPWSKLDVLTYSWQKVLGGEAQHGILVLSPRAVARLENYTPPWPIPKIFRMTKDGKLNKAIFEGETINTPSMMCTEDVLDAMAWARSVGGLKGCMQRTARNAQTLTEWVERTPWLTYLAEVDATRSPTSFCLKLNDAALTALPLEEQTAFCKKIVGMIEKEGAGYDFNAYRDAPPGFRIWCGATVEEQDIRILTQWIDWAYALVRAELSGKGV